MEGDGPSPSELGLNKKDLGIDPERKKQVRAFSRSSEKGQQSRSKTAQDLIDARRESRSHEAAIVSAGQQTAEIESNLSTMEAKKEELAQQADLLNQELERRKSSWLSRIRDRIAPGKRRSLEQKITDTTTTREDLGSNLQTALVDRARASLEQQRIERTPPIDPIKVLRAHYQEQEGKLREQEEEVRKRENTRIVEELRKELEAYKDKEGSVEQALQRHDTYILHGLTTADSGNQSSVLRAGVNWHDRLAIDVVLAPPISCRGLRKGEPSQDTFSDVGIILNEGRIDEASNTSLEGASREIGKKVATMAGSRTIENYQRRLGEALDNPGKTSELIISNPGIAGLFINLDSRNVRNGVYYGGYDRHGKPRNVSMFDVITTAGEYGMKAFAIKGGLAYELILDPKGRIALGQVSSPKDMLSQTYQVPDENKSKIADQASRFLVGDQKLSFPDIKQAA